MSKNRSIDFWYEFASPYSYLSAMRIEAEAARHQIVVNWKPFLLGPIFRQLGYQDSPFNAQPAKLQYMWRDMKRCCDAQGLAFKRPDPFPGNAVKAARIAILGADQNWGASFTKGVFEAYFGRGDDMACEDVLRTILTAVAADNIDDIWGLAFSDGNKARLRLQTEHASTLNIFGAPTFLRDQELFWGNDRLENALAFSPP
ncbi:MAG: 2-hydroxychromene-2-carboxylate isomerase [Magnetovibrio sp.]|nr:2-hydroxychromene-2-carboxylate isomerase [Magnetovibrio sp.]